MCDAACRGMGTRELFDAIRTSSTGASERPTCVGHPGAMHGRLRDPVGAVHGVPVAPEVGASLGDGSFLSGKRLNGKTW